MKKYILLFLNLSALGGLLLNLISCNTTEPPIIPPPPDLRKITLTFEDASCTEVWLKIKADSLTLPAEIKLMSDAVTQNIMLTTKDTVLYIDSLLPNQAYNYQAVLSIDTTIKSEKVTAQTLEPTSHNFTWQSWEFGQHSSSLLYDVAIIDENNIWAVGEIYMNDSLGNTDLVPYSIAKWDGIKWELKKIFYNTNSIIAPIRGILVLNSNEIYLSAGGIFRWDGLSSHAQLVFSRLNLPDPNATIEKLWGRSSNAIFGVGNVGTLVYSSGNTWTILEIGTTSNINDIWGEVDQVTGERKILCAVSNISGGGEKKILNINSNNTIDTVKWGINRRIHSIWFKGNHKTYTSGGGVFLQSEKDKWVEQAELPLYFTDKIRGTDYNNIITVGAFGFAAHFNGLNWKVLNDIPSADVLGSISIKDNIIVTTGFNNSKAIIIIGNHH